jgi:D-amino-acid dehydrogenase
MKIVIVGSGLIGVTAAYVLRGRGHEVVVLDRESGPGLGASFANAALLTPSMSEPWNAPGSWRVLLSSLGRSDAALQVRLRALPGLVGWGITFLRNSRAATIERNAVINLRLACHSLEVMHSLRQETQIEYGRAARGTLRILRTSAALELARTSAARLAAHGLGFRTLSCAETLELEPALVPIAGEVKGAIYCETDETGDAYRFCVEMTKQAQRRGVEFHFGVDVDFLDTTSKRVRAAVGCGRRFVADQYIVAAGSYSTPLLRHLGIRLPVRPVKGYSVTFDGSREAQSLRTPIIDDHLHAAVVPIKGALRVAGTAEFAGYDQRLNPDRIRNLLGLLRQVLRQAPLDPKAAKPWCGLRAVSADGVPLIGFTPVENLMVATGHGHLGWTMAAGSAQLLADLVAGKTPSIDPAPYNPKRFALRR